MGSLPDLTRSIHVRVLDASPADATRAATVCARLSGAVADPLVYSDPRQCLDALSDASADVLIIDIETAGGDEALARFAVRSPGAIIIATSSHGSVTQAMNAMRAGAHDFIAKPFTLDALMSKVQAQLDGRRPQLQPQSARRDTPAMRQMDPASRAPIGRFTGTSQLMTGVYNQIGRLAPSDAPVFITGESGTGKSLCAEAIHVLSGRAGNRFVSINCAGLSVERIDTELFGDGSEAYPGATAQAAGGTLFLDEVNELDLSLQAKLLLLLQDKGLAKPEDGALSSLRIMCSSSRDPLAEVATGRLREDLYYRLNVLPVHLPPLRERREDILPLALEFLTRFAGEDRRSFRGFDADAEARLEAYAWPGNVRQLENTIRQIVVMNNGTAVTYDMLPHFIREASARARLGSDEARERRRPARGARPLAAIEPLWAQERRIIEDALDAFDGNIALAAAALEISPSTIYRKKQSWSERSAAM